VLRFAPPRMLTAEEACDLPSEDACAAYRARGWHVTRAILPAALLDAVAADVARHARGDVDAALPPIATRMDWTSASRQVIRIHGYLALQLRAVQALVAHPLIGAIAARLTATEEVRLFHDRLIIKPGGLPAAATETGWHTDVAYWRTSSSHRLLTAWIALDGCPADAGPLAVVEGSQRWAEPCLERRFLTPDIDGEVPAAMVPPGVTPRIVTLPVERGQIVFHHCGILHRSSPNRGARDRIALAVHLQDRDNRFVPCLQPNGRQLVHSNDLLCRRGPDGRPDFRDPAVFPVLWSAATPSPPPAPPPR